MFPFVPVRSGDAEVVARRIPENNCLSHVGSLPVLRKSTSSPSHSRPRYYWRRAARKLGPGHPPATPTLLATMVLLATIGVFPSGRAMFTARQGLLKNTLLIITGEESFTKLTTAESNWVSHVLPKGVILYDRRRPVTTDPAPNSCALRIIAKDIALDLRRRAQKDDAGAKRVISVLNREADHF